MAKKQNHIISNAFSNAKLHWLAQKSNIKYNFINITSFTTFHKDGDNNIIITIIKRKIEMVLLYYENMMQLSTLMHVVGIQETKMWSHYYIRYKRKKNVGQMWIRKTQSAQIPTIQDKRYTDLIKKMLSWSSFTIRELINVTLVLSIWYLSILFVSQAHSLNLQILLYFILYI